MMENKKIIKGKCQDCGCKRVLHPYKNKMICLACLTIREAMANKK